MKKLFMVLAATVCGSMLMMSCNKNDDLQEEYTGVPLVILDTDIGSSTDDLFALEMGCRYAGTHQDV